jgi:purine-binding chemotaxis protein CheW
MPIYEHFSETELEVLRARAERAARITNAENAEEILTVLQIKLGSEAYALPVTPLRAVYENMTVIAVPCTPPFIAGIANIRGRITPVLDMAVLLNVPRLTSAVSPALVVVSGEDVSLALRVDGIKEIVTFPTSSIGPLPESGEALKRAGYLQGILTDGSTLVNVVAILKDPTLVVDDTPV